MVKVQTDILIGANLYWLLVNGEVKKNDCSDLAAIRSNLVGSWPSSKGWF